MNFLQKFFFFWILFWIFLYLNPSLCLPNDQVINHVLIDLNNSGQNKILCIVSTLTAKSVSVSHAEKYFSWVVSSEEMLSWFNHRFLFWSFPDGKGVCLCTHSFHDYSLNRMINHVKKTRLIKTGMSHLWHLWSSCCGWSCHESREIFRKTHFCIQFSRAHL